MEIAGEETVLIDLAPLADQGIPTLPAVLDPVELCKHLAFFSGPPWQWGQLTDVRVQVLKCHSGSRCTVQIALRTGTGAYALIGKVYVSNGLEIYQAMKRISQSGFGPEAEFSIPQPLAFLPELHLVVQELVSGRLAQEFFMTGGERDYSVAAERCARWLARFHAVAPKMGPGFDLNGYLTSLERWSRRIADLGEPLATKAGRLFQRLEGTAAALSPVKACAGHGSYCQTQIILANGRVVTFDWDGHDVADPSRDVARFVASLKRLALGHFGSIRSLDAAVEIFLKTYAAAARPEVELNLPFYEAATCIKLAKYEISKRPNHWRKTIMEALLDEGLHILEPGR